VTGHTRRRAPPGGAGQRWQLHADSVRLKCAGLCGWVGDRSSFTGAADGSARRPRRQSARGQPPGRSLPGKCFSATAGSDPMMMTARPAWPGGARPGVAVCPAAAGPRARVRRQPGPRARRRYVPRWLRLSAELSSGPALLLAADVDGGTRRGGSAHPVPGPRARVRGRPPPPLGLHRRPHAQPQFRRQHRYSRRNQRERARPRRIPDTVGQLRAPVLAAMRVKPSMNDTQLGRCARTAQWSTGLAAIPPMRGSQP
jgi:hypothetical protein